MEPRFKMSYKVTIDIYKELYRYYMFQRTIRIVLNIVLLIAFLLDLLLTVLKGYIFAGAVVFVPLIYLLEFYIYHKRVSMWVKRSKEMKHDDLFTTYEFFEDHLVFTSSNGGRAQVSLSDIKYFEQSKNLILLISKANLAYWFPADSFEIGDLEEFKKFLRSKEIKLKP